MWLILCGKYLLVWNKCIDSLIPVYVYHPLIIQSWKMDPLCIWAHRNCLCSVFSGEMLSLLQGRLHKHNTGCFSLLPQVLLAFLQHLSSPPTFSTAKLQPLWNDTLLSRTWFSPWLKRLRGILLKVHHNCTCGLSRGMCPLSQDGSCWLNTNSLFDKSALILF